VADLVLVRPMRGAIILALATQTFLSSCALQIVDGARVYGRIHSVSVTDIREAMAADKLAHINPNVPYEPYYIQVSDRNEIHVYHRTHSDYKQFTVVRRVGSHWKVTKIGIESDHPI
jgi:hypothetical protein